MAGAPIPARCRGCGAEFLLAELVRATSGRCPGCGESLAPGNTLILLEEARRADALRRALVTCLDRLVGLPGGLELDREAVLRDTLAAVAWPERLAVDREVIRAEAAELPERARVWRRLPHERRRREGASLAADIRRIAQRLRHHGDLVEQRNAALADRASLDPRPVRDAAEKAEGAADAVARDQRLADDRVRDAVGSAQGSLAREAQADPDAEAPAAAPRPVTKGSRQASGRAGSR